MQVDSKLISYIGILFKVQFIQDIILFRVLFKQVSLYNLHLGTVHNTI